MANLRKMLIANAYGLYSIWSVWSHTYLAWSVYLNRIKSKLCHRLDKLTVTICFIVVIGPFTQVMFHQAEVAAYGY